MKRVIIKQVSFRANVPVDGRYGHIHIEATADVPVGERAEAVVDALKLFVAKELRRAREGEVPAVPVGRFRV